MGKNGRIVMLAAIVSLAGLGWVCLRGPDVADPVYKGKPLSYWLQGYSTGIRPGTGPSSSEATEAVFEAGTNGLPLLVHMLGARDSKLKMRLDAWIWRVTKNRNRLMDLDQNIDTNAYARAVTNLASGQGN
jgi:hypothetical protein